jgi:hypothetical protein
MWDLLWTKWWGGGGAGFLSVLWFPQQILIPPNVPFLSSVAQGWYNRPLTAKVPIEFVPPHTKIKNKAQYNTKF